MYFVKTRKHLEAQEANESPEKNRQRDRYQRSDSARLVLQALPHQSKNPVECSHGATVSIPILSTEANRGTSAIASSIVDSPADFKPEELPDGACYRPKKDLTNLPVSKPASTSPVSSGSFPAQNVTSTGDDSASVEYVRPAENTQDRRPVNLIISNSGVKVVLVENNNVFMDHSLKRIWYATSDPEYCQFSFLAREPKTSAEVQFCHAFVTKTAEQAEELISIIGNAFKSTYAKAKKQPTFHELIEQQVQQQQARFREIEVEAKNALQQKLKEIATPTPFSEKAQFRMEQRRKSEDTHVVMGLEKVWAKQQIEQYGVKHAVSPERNAKAGVKRQSEVPIRHVVPQPSRFQRNSIPPQAASTSSSVPSSPPSHPLPALAVKESVEIRSSNIKFKGSPVTVLKNEIDKRLSMASEDDTQSASGLDRDLRKEQERPSKQQPNIMANRPLPFPPSISLSPQRSPKHMDNQSPLQQLHLQKLQQLPHAFLNQCSLDDYHLPRSSSSQMPLSSNARNEVVNVKIRDSPSRRQTRPASEIVTSSCASSYIGLRDESSFYQQQQSLLSNFAARFHQPHGREGDADDMFIYGKSQLDEDGCGMKEQGFSEPQLNRGRNFKRRADVRLTEAVKKGYE